MPPEVYPDTVLDWPAAYDLATVKLPTSVALPSEAKGNLSIIFLLELPPAGWPPDV